jgi:N-acetylmuramoyl-L-alanine amidase
MLTAAFRRALPALLLGCALTVHGAPLSATRFGGAEYVSVYDVCGKLGLKFSDSGNGRAVTVRNAAHTGVFAADSREMTLDGVKVLLSYPSIARGGHFYLSRTDYERRLQFLFRPDLALPIRRHPRVIVLDPGHGGVDPGALNLRYHAQEKVFTLDVAFRLEKLLLAAGYQVVLTRRTDVKIPLPDRPAIAERAGADLFLSIHFDAAPGSTHGSEILTFVPVGQLRSDHLDRPARTQAELGNRLDDWNAILAHAIFRRLPSTWHTYDHGEKIEDLSVLRTATCPAVLVEPAFLSNDAEVLRVETPAFRQEVAEGLAAGIKDYTALVDSLLPRPPPPPRPVPPPIPPPAALPPAQK